MCSASPDNTPSLDSRDPAKQISHRNRVRDLLAHLRTWPSSLVACGTTAALCLGLVLQGKDVYAYLFPPPPDVAKVVSDAQIQLMQKMGGDVGKGALLNTVLAHSQFRGTLRCRDIGDWNDATKACERRPILSGVNTLTPMLNASRPKPTHKTPTGAVFQEVDFVRAQLTGADLFSPAFQDVTFSMSDLRNSTTDANFGAGYQIETSDLTGADIAVRHDRLPTFSNVSGATIRLFPKPGETSNELAGRLNMEGLWAWADNPPKFVLSTLDVVPAQQAESRMRQMSTQTPDWLVSVVGITNQNAGGQDYAAIFGQMDFSSLLHSVRLCDPALRISAKQMAPEFVFPGYEPWPLYRETGLYQPFLKYCPGLSVDDARQRWPERFAQVVQDNEAQQLKRGERMWELLYPDIMAKILKL